MCKLEEYAAVGGLVVSPSMLPIHCISPMGVTHPSRLLKWIGATNPRLSKRLFTVDKAPRCVKGCWLVDA